MSDQEFLDTAPAEFLDEEAAVETNTETEETEVPSVEEGSDAQEQTDVETNQDEVSQPEGDTQTEHEKSNDSDARLS